jgi:hypothetical protein
MLEDDLDHVWDVGAALSEDLDDFVRREPARPLVQPRSPRGASDKLAEFQ